MKISHLSDLHLGKRLNEYSLIEDQAFILEECLRIVQDEKPDAVLMAGDIYDKSMPSAEAVRLFEAGCRWTSGSRHTRYAHIHASSREGVWNADDGWTFVRKNSLEVLQICPECDGSGKEDGWVTCPGCNGEGEVETTLSGFTSFIDDLANGIEAVDNFNRALHGKSPHGSGGHSHSRQYVTCNTCNGRGEVAQQRRCSRCGGRGTLR